jgi:hypothetical protein
MSDAAEPVIVPDPPVAEPVPPAEPAEPAVARAAGPYAKPFEILTIASVIGLDQLTK